MVLTAECTVCFTFWLMHSHNLPTLFYCIYIWPHTQKYTDACVESDPSTGPVHQTDILMDEAVSACVCCLSSSQMTLSVDHTHTHTAWTYTDTNTLRHLQKGENSRRDRMWVVKKKKKKWYDEERRNCKRRWGKYFFFLFCFLNWPPARTVKETQWFCFMFIRNTRTEAVKPLACLSEMWVHTRPTLMIQFEFLF